MCFFDSERRIDCSKRTPLLERGIECSSVQVLAASLCDNPFDKSS